MMKKRNKIGLVLSIILILMIFGAGCTDTTPATEPPPPAPSFTPETYPVIDGSTVTIPLSEALAGRLMGLPVEEARQYVLHNKTHAAYLNLIYGKADLIFVTGPSEEELKLAEDQGVELEIIPVVHEGFVFLANEANPVEGLTLEQIRGIYTGKITNWKEVGGSDMPITAYQRPVNSGSQTGFLEMVMKEEMPMEPLLEQVVAEMGALIDAVAAYDNEPSAIGYSYYYFVMDMWGNDQIKLLSVDGIFPDKETIRDGSYPLNTAYYAVIRKDEPDNSPVRKIIDWLLTEEGQLLAEEAGYVRAK
jgi:phosphate transport system substrate-binding protein